MSDCHHVTNVETLHAALTSLSTLNSDVALLIAEFGCNEWLRCIQCDNTQAFYLLNGKYRPPLFEKGICNQCSPRSFGSVAALFDESDDDTDLTTEDWARVVELFW